MPFDPTLAAIRFGMGLSPTISPPRSVDDMMAHLAGLDVAARDVPIPTFSRAYPSAADLRNASRALNAARGTDAQAAAEEAQATLRADGRRAVTTYMAATFARAAHAQDGFRERLTHFWADHFTVRAVNGTHRHLVSAHIETAIRPNVTATFGDMLVAAINSPMMIVYLDQHQSMGPNSRAAQNRDRGLNENMAREVLELHTLGVGGAYAQSDVRGLAELLTGLTVDRDNLASFRVQQAEPGAETVLGVTYGGAQESLEHIVAVLHDLAVHPDTARHLSRKLAVHFVGPQPDTGMVDAMTSRYLETGGDLMAVYAAMLDIEAAWVPERQKVKQPFDFVASSLRALGTPKEVIVTASLQEVRQVLENPMAVMGQPWQNPVGPDGWSEAAENWITPQGMAGRITWAMTMPDRLGQDLPDPRDFVQTALGPTPPDNVVFAAGAAETRTDGVGIVLASAAFQRR